MVRIVLNDFKMTGWLPESKRANYSAIAHFGNADRQFGSDPQIPRADQTAPCHQWKSVAGL